MMVTAVPNALPLSGLAVPDVDFEAVIAGLPNKDCDHFTDAYGAGEIVIAAVEFFRQTGR